ncbi:unnamed protein product [Lathyrus oleraceus]
MSNTFEDISCFLHLPIRGRLLDHGRITKDEALKMMVYHLGADPGETNDELDKTRDAHSRVSLIQMSLPTVLPRVRENP